MKYRDGILVGKHYPGWTWAMHLSHSTQFSHKTNSLYSRCTDSDILNAGDTINTGTNKILPRKQMGMDMGHVPQLNKLTI